MFNSNQFFGGVGEFYPVSIDQSLRFNDDDSAYLSRTPSSTTNQKIFTVSSWVKRGNLSTQQNILGAGPLDDQLHVQFIGDRFGIRRYVTGNTTAVFTEALLRDVSAWYHLVVSVDTTQATDTDRVKLYVNGVQQSVVDNDGSTVNWPSLNEEFSLNDSSHAMYIGRRGHSLAYLADFYLAEVHFTDGTAYDADAFGELKSGVWVAKTPSVAYGTNGFYLDFANSADIGNDVSGEGNDWTPNNFTASDVVADSPTDNFATLNALAKNPDRGNLSDGNLKIVGTDTNWAAQIATIGVSSGKWYAEFTFSGSGGNDINVGIQSEAGVFFMDDTDHYLGKQSVNFGYFANGNKVTNASQSAYGSSYTNGDVIGVALNMDDGEVTFYKNNVSQGVAFTGLSGTYFIGLSTYRTGVAEFGQGSFTYTPPTDYLALSTANLPEPTISPADDASPEDYFNTVLYTGNGSTQSIDVGFATDFTWIKWRDGTGSNQIYDTVRGATNRLRLDRELAEDIKTNGLTSFDPDGFTVGDQLGVNALDDLHVAWNWKSNGSGVSNTVGDIASTVSANTTSGFSIVSYTGDTTTTPVTVGHGLSQKPEMILFKRRTGSSTANWNVYHEAIGATARLKINLTDASQTTSAPFNDTEPTNTVFTVNTSTNVNPDGDDVIAYCFHSVEGFSKIGSYTGNGSSDGPFVYTGFQPAFVLFKKTNITTASWAIRDNTRYTYNPTRNTLYADKPDAEYTGTAHDVDFLSNGFKPRTTDGLFNSSGATYIYMAFAENPFKYSNAR